MTEKEIFHVLPNPPTEARVLELLNKFPKMKSDIEGCAKIKNKIHRIYMVRLYVDMYNAMDKRLMEGACAS